MLAMSNNGEVQAFDRTQYNLKKCLFAGRTILSWQLIVADIGFIFFI